MAWVNSVMCSQPRVTSERRPFSHSIGLLTDAPAARYHSHAAFKSDTFTARFAMPVTATGRSYDDRVDVPSGNAGEHPQRGDRRREEVGAAGHAHEGLQRHVRGKRAWDRRR